jgi:uncharacterized protein YjbI with pentapeptide repeats
MRSRLMFVVALAVELGACFDGISPAWADIDDTRTGQAIPGTQGIALAPGLDLSGWNTSGHNLRYGDFSNRGAGGVDLAGDNFNASWLDNADFRLANLQGANLSGATITYANFSGAAGLLQSQFYSTASYKNKDLTGVIFTDNDLTNFFFSGQNLTNSVLRGATIVSDNFKNVNATNADFRNANLSSTRFDGAILTGALFSGANIANTVFDQTNLTSQQLYSTANYQNKSLSVSLAGDDLTGWNFGGQHMSNVDLSNATVTGTIFSGATINNVYFLGSVGLTEQQIDSTASYQNHDLSYVAFQNLNLTGWHFAGQNLSHASVFLSTIDGADFTNANLSNAGAGTDARSALGTNFSGANLSNDQFFYCPVLGANFTGAIISATNFGYSKLTSQQLYSTANYQNGDLAGVGFSGLDVTGWNFAGQNVNGADFASATGLTSQQLYSTASYQNHNLGAMRLDALDMSGWNFVGQNLQRASFGAYTPGANLTGANMTDANLSGAKFGTATMTNANMTNANLAFATIDQVDLTGANLTGAFFANALFEGVNTFTGANLRDADFRAAYGVTFSPTFATASMHNTIMPDGTITPLALDSGEQLVVHAFPEGGNAPGGVAITVERGMSFSTSSSLQFLFDGKSWGSTMSLAPGVSPQLAGTLDLEFALGVDPAALVGTKFQLFVWNGQLGAGQQFDHITTRLGVTWDTSHLYSDGYATLTAVAEPSTLMLGCTGLVAFALCFRRRVRGENS